MWEAKTKLIKIKSFNLVLTPCVTTFTMKDVEKELLTMHHEQITYASDEEKEGF